jgi:hypothetical protein
MRDETPKLSIHRGSIDLTVPGVCFIDWSRIHPVNGDRFLEDRLHQRIDSICHFQILRIGKSMSSIIY